MERLQCYDRMKNFWTWKKTSHCFHWKILVYVSYNNYKIFGLCTGDYSLFIFIIYQKLLYRRAGQIALQLLKYEGESIMKACVRGVYIVHPSPQQCKTDNFYSMDWCLQRFEAQLPCLSPFSKQGDMFSMSASWASKPELLGYESPEFRE